MNDAGQTRPDNRPAREWLNYATFGIVAVAAVALFLGVTLKRQRAEEHRVRSEIDKRLAAIRAAGQPLTVQDLAKLYPDPAPECDAACLLDSALEQLSIPQLGGNLPFVSTAPIPRQAAPLEDQVRMELQSLLQTNKAALTAALGAGLERAWFGSGFSGGFTNLAKPPMVPLMNLVQLLCLDAIYQAELGDGEAAARSLERSLALSRTFRSDTGVHHDVRRAGESLTCQALERVVNRTRLSEANLSSLAVALADVNPHGLETAMMGERCLGLCAFEMMHGLATQVGGTTDVPVLQMWAASIGRRIYNKSDLRLYLDGYERRLAALRLPAKERLAVVSEVEIKASKAESDQMSTALAIAERPWRRSVRHDAEVQAQMLGSRIALAIERWRLTHAGRPPDSLTELVPDWLPALPFDPFDQQPLRYRKLPRGYVVYSIGPDFTDDGGKGKPATASDSDHYDITFTVER